MTLFPLRADSVERYRALKVTSKIGGIGWNGVGLPL
jgi:hypothetical protein